MRVQDHEPFPTHATEAAATSRRAWKYTPAYLDAELFRQALEALEAFEVVPRVHG